jgi:hypothetical protein
MPEPDYSGFWLADDGGMYFIRQFDTVLWWVGVNRGEPGETREELCPGLRFCNVYHASVTGRHITGDWSDVPRGTASNGGTLTLEFRDDNQLHRVSETGGFSASTWQQWPTGDTQWPVVSAAETFQQTFKNVVGGGDFTEKERLAGNLKVLKDSATVFAVITLGETDGQPPVSRSYPSSGFSYNDFMCLNDRSLSLGVADQDDCDASFYIRSDTNQVAQRQPLFFDGIEEGDKDVVYHRLSGDGTDGFEGEIIMFGRSADCNDDLAENFPALLPGWAERPDSSVLFNGKPIRLEIPGWSGGIEPFEISFGDPVRVTGVLVFDHGHHDIFGREINPQKLEIHPVYSVDKITATSAGLSGAWADDVGNTYYLRHDPANDTVWYVGLTPLDSAAFAQVFRGIFYPTPAIKDSAVPAIPKGIGTSPVTPPQNVLIGDVVAIDLGWGTAAPFEVSGTRLGDTGSATFVLGSTEIVGRNVLTLSIGNFRLMKLYDA